MQNFRTGGLSKFESLVKDCLIEPAKLVCSSFMMTVWTTGSHKGWTYLFCSIGDLNFYLILVLCSHFYCWIGNDNLDIMPIKLGWCVDFHMLMMIKRGERFVANLKASFLLCTVRNPGKYWGCFRDSNFASSKMCLRLQTCCWLERMFWRIYTNFSSYFCWTIKG